MSDYDFDSIIDLSNQLNDCKKENQQLKARIARLERPLAECIWLLAAIKSRIAKEAGDILNESPKQSLAAIQADGIDAAIEYADEYADWASDIGRLVREYAQQLRQQGKEKQ